MSEKSFNLGEKLSLFSELWTPKIVAGFNDNHIMVVKVRGEFNGYSYPDTDDFFMVLSGRLRIQLRAGDVVLGSGELYVVPKGVEHCTFADGESHLLLIEPTGVPNTGDPANAVTNNRIRGTLGFQELPFQRSARRRRGCRLRYGASMTMLAAIIAARTMRPSVRSPSLQTCPPASEATDAEWSLSLSRAKTTTTSTTPRPDAASSSRPTSSNSPSSNISSRDLSFPVNTVKAQIKRFVPFEALRQSFCNQPQGTTTGHGEL